MSGAGAIALGSVSFGPAYSLRVDVEDSMAASIIRLECENEELRAEVALLQEQARIIAQERDKARETVLKLRRERAAQDKVIESYRDEACREKCRDKAAADGGWASI